MAAPDEFPAGTSYVDPDIERNGVTLYPVGAGFCGCTERDDHVLVVPGSEVAEANDDELIVSIERKGRKTVTQVILSRYGRPERSR